MRTKQTLAVNLEERHFVNFVETGVVTAEAHHKLVVHLVVDAAFVLSDEEMMVGAVRSRAVHSFRIQIDRPDGGRRPDFVFHGPFFYHPVYRYTRTQASLYIYI